MAKEKVSLHLSRNITLERHGKEAVKMFAGRNTVDADVAEHPFVKAHMVDAAEAVQADADLQAKLAEVMAANDEGAKQLRDALNRAESAETKVVELQTMLEAFNAAAGKGGKK